MNILLIVTIFLALVAAGEPDEKENCGCAAELFRPVCGDGVKSYSNPCEAVCNGVTELKEGFCEEENILAENSAPAFEAELTKLSPFRVGLRGAVCRCPQDNQPVCGYRRGSWRTFANGCVAFCAGARSIVFGGCKPNRYVKRGSALMEPSKPKVCHCPHVYSPVCGKNGRTYDNAQCATCYGIYDTTTGPCDKVDIIPVKKRTSPTCHCSTMFYPVCGSDGETYLNEDCAVKCGHVRKVIDGRCGQVCPQCKKDKSDNAVCDSKRVYYYNRCYAKCFGAQGDLTEPRSALCE